MANPLTADDKAAIDKHLAAIKDAKADLARAKAANIDVADLEAQLVDAERRLTSIRAAYFPTGK